MSTVREVNWSDLDALAETVAREFPWLRLLSRPEIKEFIREFADAVVAAAELSRWDLVDRLVHAWKATAAIHADPDLAARLSTPIDADHGPVPSPAHGEQAR